MHKIKKIFTEYRRLRRIGFNFRAALWCAFHFSGQ